MEVVEVLEMSTVSHHSACSNTPFHVDGFAGAVLLRFQIGHYGLIEYDERVKLIWDLQLQTGN